MAALFKNMLGSGESLFRDVVALDYDFLPKIIPFRAEEQRRFALAIRPLLQEQNGRNLFVYGAPGIGKTTACKHVLRELEETTDDIIPFYVNCWKHNTTYKVLLELCRLIGIRLIITEKTGELFDKLRKEINKKSAVFIFDEFDKVEEHDFLYMILEDIYRKSVIIITNWREKYDEFDERLRSRLSPDFVYFKPYLGDEIKGILSHRMEYAFVPDIWQPEALAFLMEEAASLQDVRAGLFMMREAALIAEEKAMQSITLEHAKDAVEKAKHAFVAGNKDELGHELLNLLAFLKAHEGVRIGQLYEEYQKHTGEPLSYRSFQRKIEKLEGGKFLTTKKMTGKDGNTTYVYCSSEKKLTEY